VRLVVFDDGFGTGGNLCLLPGVAFTIQYQGVVGSFKVVSESVTGRLSGLARGKGFFHAQAKGVDAVSDLAVVEAGGVCTGLAFVVGLGCDVVCWVILIVCGAGVRADLFGHVVEAVVMVCGDAAFGVGDLGEHDALDLPSQHIASLSHHSLPACMCSVFILDIESHAPRICIILRQCTIGKLAMTQ